MSWESATATLFVVTALVAMHSGTHSRLWLFIAIPVALLSTVDSAFQDSAGNKDFSSLKGMNMYVEYPLYVVVARFAEYLVDSIEEVVSTYGLPENFIGVILLPLVGRFRLH